MLIRAKTSNYFTTKRNGDENLVTMSTVLNGGNMNTSNDVFTKKRQLELACTCAEYRERALNSVWTVAKCILHKSHIPTTSQWPIFHRTIQNDQNLNAAVLLRIKG